MIPPGVNTKQFSDKIKERDIDILAAGSLIPLKRYGLFIEIIAEIEKRVPGLKVILAGDGPERQNLQKQFEESSLQATISLVGELPYEEVLQLMQRTKIFLHTSRYEGFGVVCIEALYAGAKVISFTKPMNKENKKLVSCNWEGGNV
ncbi:MAG: glycosyltransferase family 4 protein [Chitinophagaceae bacterium]